MVDHDAAHGAFLSSTNGKEWPDDIAEGEHTTELSMVAHDDEVGSLYDRTYLCLVAFVDEDVIGPRNPLQEVWEDIGRYDVDVGSWIMTTDPRCKRRSGADGIAVGTTMAGNDDVMGGSEEIVPEGDLVHG